MKSLNKLIILLLITISFSSCATLFTGTKQTVMFTTTPEKAKVEVNGIERCYTPCPVKLKKGSSGQIVTLSKEGYKAKTFETETTFNPVAAINLFSVLGWGIDLLSGAAWKYDPKFYQITLDTE